MLVFSEKPKVFKIFPTDIDWFGQQIRSLDPYGHPLSSRYGGGSDSIVMNGQTYESHGDRQAEISDMTNYFSSSAMPIFYSLGKNDRWDWGNGGPITLNLISINGKTYNARWFDPRSGNETAAETLADSNDYTLNPPSTDDWVLILDEGSADDTPPNAPTGLKVINLLLLN